MATENTRRHGGSRGPDVAPAQLTAPRSFLPPEHAQVVIRVDEKLEVSLDLLESKLLEDRVRPQTVNVARTPGLEAYHRIQPCLAAGHAHDFEERALVEFVVELILVNEKQIGHERQVEFAVAKRQHRQAPGHVTVSRPFPVIRQERTVGALAKLPQVLRR